MTCAHQNEYLRKFKQSISIYHGTNIDISQLEQYLFRFEESISIYLANLAWLCVASSFLLVWALFGKANAEHSQGVTISCLNINMSLNQWLPFLYQWPQLICGEVHTIKVCQDISSLDIFSSQTNLPEGVIFVILKISQWHFEHTMLQAFWSNLEWTNNVIICWIVFLWYSSQSHINYYG